MAGASEKGGAGEGAADVDKELSKNARKIASTFAPRSSTAKKNPAFKGSALYTIFEVRASSTNGVMQKARPPLSTNSALLFVYFFFPSALVGR